jgi:hypothetical protein
VGKNFIQAVIIRLGFEPFGQNSLRVRLCCVWIMLLRGLKYFDGRRRSRGLVLESLREAN